MSAAGLDDAGDALFHASLRRLIRFALAYALTNLVDRIRGRSV